MLPAFPHLAVAPVKTSADSRESRVNKNGRHAMPLVLHRPYTLKSQKNKKGETVDFTITYPSTEIGDSKQLPLVLFYGGHGINARDYRDYAQLLASRGFVVVQYTKGRGLFNYTLEKTEMEWFPEIMSWVRGDLKKELPSKTNADIVGVAGHSRGGKLAALVALENPSVRTAFLIDPVDRGYGLFCPAESEDSPSAVKLLKGKNKEIAIVGGGVGGVCTPEEHNYRKFWEVAGDGSRLAVVPDCGHCQFLKLSGLFGWSQSIVCSTGNAPYEITVGDTSLALLAWMDYKLKQRGRFSEKQELANVKDFQKLLAA